MQCITAKQNIVLMRQAICHYLENDKGNKTPLFTFTSLYSDSEPYPLPELLIVLENRIAKLQQEIEAMPNESDVTTLGILKKQHSKLLKVAERMREGITSG